MKWQNLMVEQFQLLSERWQDKSGEEEEFDVMADTCAICYNLTPRQVDSLPIAEFKKLCADLAFLNEVPDWKPVTHVTVNGRRYRFVYDVRQIHAARNMEVKQFGTEGLVPNLHKVAASMIVPQYRTWYRRWKDAPYDAAKHELYAADIRQAPITAIYGSALFFCNVFRELIAVTTDYLTSTIPAKNQTEARRLFQISCDFLGGSTTLPGSQNTSASPLTKLTPSHISSS